MRRFAGILILIQFTMTCGLAVAAGQLVLTEQQLQEKMKANRILDMYLTDAGITGHETNEYGAPSNEFLVPGPYAKMPKQILVLAQEHNIQILPSQLSAKTDRRAWLPMILWLFNVCVLLSILITVIIINKRVANIEKLIKK
jgi:hypothetical protein